MQLNRKDFLKLSVPATGLFCIATPPLSGLKLPQVFPTISNNTVAKAVLLDTSKCVGCLDCVTACQKWNKLTPELNPQDFSPVSWTLVKSRPKTTGNENDFLYSKWQCMHCVQPTCTAVCPVGALSKTEDGPVLYDKTRCIGCEYCVTACPFHAPRFDNGENRVVDKCTMCADRLANGLEPACVEICKYHALAFGRRDAIIAKANEAESQGAYVYGRNEVGGTSWIYVSAVPFRERGFPEVGQISYPDRSRGMWISQIVTMVVGVALIWAMSWYMRRRGKAVKGEAKDEI